MCLCVAIVSYFLDLTSQVWGDIKALAPWMFWYKKGNVAFKGASTKVSTHTKEW